VQATMHCGRFSTEIDILDDRLIEGTIVEQIDETMDFLKKHTNVRFVIT
jgi:ATP-dependent DNA helicase RecG